MGAYHSQSLHYLGDNEDPRAEYEFSDNYAEGDYNSGDMETTTIAHKLCDAATTFVDISGSILRRRLQMHRGQMPTSLCSMSVHSTHFPASGIFTTNWNFAGEQVDIMGATDVWTTQ
ncbi:Glycoside hydrolasesuperfamily [Penicillium lividum]|nr:Glycoside hydrolasesuperfamily [Penicillium lividum]